MKSQSLLCAALFGAMLAGCALKGDNSSSSSVPSPVPTLGAGAEDKPSVKISPPNYEQAANINVQLGVSYLQHGDLNTAKVKLERALEQKPDLAQAHWAYALLQQRLGNDRLAEEHYRKSLSLDPNDPNAHNNFGVFLCAGGRVDDALREFAAAYRNALYETPETALTNAASCEIKKGDQAEAERLLRLALDHERDYAPALYELAKLELDRGLHDPAQAFIRHYAEVAGEDPGELWRAIEVARRLDDAQTVSALGDKLTRQFPESNEAALYLQSQTGASR